MSGQEEDPLAKASKAADDLYRVRDVYFPANPDEKIGKLQKESDLAIKLLDSIPPGKLSKLNDNRANPFHNLNNSCL